MKSTVSLIVIAMILSGCTAYSEKNTTSNSTMKAPFGNPDDTAYASSLWNELITSGLNTKPATLYIGGPPHGKVREVLEGTLHGKRVIVKRNYGGEGVSVEKVSGDRANYLKAITVMAKREAGYDSENSDWFWVKYKPDGTLHANPKGMLLAGRVAKGMSKGCIACHKSASGNDMVFAHNKDANAEITIVK